jgi:Ca-activated chloride channel homolog
MKERKYALGLACVAGALLLVWGCFSGNAWYGDDSGGGGADVGDAGRDEPTGDDNTGDDDTGDDDTVAEEEEEDDEPSPCDDAPAGPVTLYLSADDSNSMAAPVIARQLIAEQVEIRGGMRPYEFLNYHDFDFPPAEQGHVDIVPQLRVNEDGEYSMLLALVAPSTERFGRRPRSLVFSVDSSGSMTGHSIELARAVLREAAHNLQAGDIVSVLSWDTDVTTLLTGEMVLGPDDPELLAAIDQLQATGATDLHGGLVRAYELAEAAYDPSRLNRVILISDGGANTGVTDEALIAAYADDAEAEGIYLSGVGAAAPAVMYQDVLMNQVTDAGKGAYVFVDDLDEAARIFGDDDRFQSVMEVAARDVQLSVQIPAGFLLTEFYGEELSQDPQEVEPQHLAPGDAMVFHQVLLDCAGGDGSEVFTFTVRWVHPETRESHVETLQMTVDEMLAAADDNLLEAEAIVAYARGLVEVWDVTGRMRHDFVDGVLLQVEDAYQLTGDEELGEIVTLLEQYRGQFVDGGVWLQEHTSQMQQQRRRELRRVGDPAP